MIARPINDTMRAQLAELAGGPQKGRGFASTLHALKRRGLATFHGKGRAAHWTITPQGRAALTEGRCHA